MSTEAPPPTPPTLGPTPPSSPMPSLATLQNGALSLVFGLSWGALMLLVFGMWMRSKYAGGSVATTSVLFIGATIAAAAAAWQIFTLWFKKDSPEQKSQTLFQQRQILSYLLMAGGLGLIILAFVLGSGKSASGSFRFNLNNFAETIGALIFGLVALGGGYVLQSAEEISNPVGFLVGKVPLLKLITIVIGVACLGGFIFLSFFRRIGFEWTPELTALLAMSVLSAGCLFWLNSGTMTEDNIRLFVLVYGGFTGLILFFLSIGRAFQWRERIFGIAAWQGEDAWRFWLCAYLFFAALMLMFLSFSLARADIRVNANLRRLMYGYDAIAQTLLLLGILFELNVVIYAMMPFTYDWTQSRGVYDLSKATKIIVGGLKKETNLVVLLREGEPTYKDMRILTDNLSALSSQLKVHYINPTTSFDKYEPLAKRFRQIAPERGSVAMGVLLVIGPLEGKDDNPPHAFINIRKIVEEKPAMEPGEKPRMLFNGEAEIMKELRFLLQDRNKRKLYFLQGNDEPSFSKNDPSARFDFKNSMAMAGLGLLADKLSRDNFEVFGFSMQPELPGAKSPPNLIFAKDDPGTKRKEIPYPDCHTLIIAGASKTLSADDQASIRDYVERGGKLMVFHDVFVNNEYTKFKDTGIESLLSKLGVEVGDEVPLQPRLRGLEILGDVKNVLATPNPEAQNPLTKAFATDSVILFRGVRAVQPSKAPGRFKAETILQIDKDLRFIPEKNIAVLRDPDAFMRELGQDPVRAQQAFAQAPLSVAVAVTDTNGDKPCMVVFGDTEFITNPYLQRSQSQVEAYNFIMNSLEWMSGREPFGAPPKPVGIYSLPKSAMDKAGRMIMIPFWLMTLSVISVGLIIWVIRRR